ncbi:ABC transporter permease [Pleomorphomonas diazotrophica]|uniref:ABC transporter permease n=1 Tax=Pleomorphomonas diazotrophica TaxID=1166257 RepID=A0A1I4T551_9HYPH|nr:ABC transporter permease [Pleomorphomonas diazotrophica]PKR89555.1 ABC transporter permease [Pleomorphomonas diazotrophica]SFM71888.1 nucleoside ABC transporter membrane protein [Pleomorphomonas diazotrophica]
MRFERREHRPLFLVVLTPLLAVAAALALSGLLIAAAGAPVFEAYWRILVGAFGSRLSATETLTRATPLMLTGLAAAVAFRARVWNIGGEGQFYLGAIAVAAVGSRLLAEAPGYLSIPLLLFTGAIAGMLLLILPLWLRLRFSVDEVVTSLLLNFVAVLFVSMLIDGPLKDPLAFGWPQSQSVSDAAMLPKLVARSRLHWGFGIALVLAVVIHIVQSRTVFGLKSRAAGLSPEGAVFAGVPLARTLLLVACLSGGLAGLAGAVEVLGVKGYVTTDLSPGFGYSGIVVAMLAGLHPLGVVLAALFTATMFVGADGMSRALKIPTYIADVTVALSLITMLVAVFFAQYRIRR